MTSLLIGSVLVGPAPAVGDHVYVTGGGYRGCHGVVEKATSYERGLYLHCGELRKRWTYVPVKWLRKIDD